MQSKLAFLLILTVVFLSVYGQSLPNLTSILQSIPEASAFNELVLGKTELLKTLEDWPTDLTILAPSNGAFDEMMNSMNTSSQPSVPMVGSSFDTVVGIVSYHALNGTFYSTIFDNGETTVTWTLLQNNSYANLRSSSQVVLARKRDGSVFFHGGLDYYGKVSQADIKFNKGVIHVIDHILSLPYSVSATATHLNLTALAGALVKTGLLSILDTTPSITVFAPRNAAFQAIGNLANGFKNEQLSDILKYHVVDYPIYDISSARIEDLKVKSFQGGALTINENKGGWFVNGARITGGEEGGIVIANGIVYIIDGVLNPDHGNMNMTFTPNPVLPTQPPAFSSATFVSEVPFTTELITDIPTQTSTSSPSKTDSQSGATLHEIPVSFIGVVVTLFMTDLGSLFML